jgi:hypothetical protein
MFRKKSSSRKESTVDVMPLVACRSAPQKPNPVQVHKRWGFGGLLSRRPVHAGRGDGEGVAAAQSSGGERMDVIQRDKGIDNRAHYLSTPEAR